MGEGHIYPFPGAAPQQPDWSTKGVGIRDRERSLAAIDFNTWQVGAPDIETGDNAGDGAGGKLQQAGHMGGHFHGNDLPMLWAGW